MHYCTKKNISFYQLMHDMAQIKCDNGVFQIKWGTYHAAFMIKP